MFQLTEAEAESLRSQIVTLNAGRGRHAKYAPLAYDRPITVLIEQPPVKQKTIDFPSGIFYGKSLDISFDISKELP